MACGGIWRTCEGHADCKIVIAASTQYCCEDCKASKGHTHPRHTARCAERTAAVKAAYEKAYGERDRAAKAKG